MIESITHHKIIEGNADGESGEKGKSIANDTLENGHQPRLHAHIHSVARHETEHILGGWFLMESKI